MSSTTDTVPTHYLYKLADAAVTPNKTCIIGILCQLDRPIPLDLVLLIDTHVQALKSKTKQ